MMPPTLSSPSSRAVSSRIASSSWRGSARAAGGSRRAAAAERPPAAADPLALESMPTPHGAALRRTERCRVPAAVAEAIRASPGTVFLDTETTGLAGGTGTYVFLVGLRRGRRAGALAVTQYFMGDLDEEPALLDAVREALGGGASAGHVQRPHLRPAAARDALPPRAGAAGGARTAAPGPLSRRAGPLAGRAPDCRLSTLEGALLGLGRGDDLPGALMPQLYFRYLRTRNPAGLPRIFRHNRWDLVALAALHARAAALLGGPDPRHDPVEWMGAGRWLERREPDRSARFYEAALRAGSARGARARRRVAARAGSGGGRGGSARRGRSGWTPWRAPSARRSGS